MKEKRADIRGPLLVRDAAGAGLVRFASTGSVIVLKGEIHENTSNWDGIGEANSFIVRNHSGAKQAVVTPEGDVYLAGEVDELEGDLACPAEGATAFIVRDAEQVLALIDEEGNLKLRGQLIVKGIPYSLLCYMDGEPDPDDDEYIPVG